MMIVMAGSNSSSAISQHPAKAKISKEATAHQPVNQCIEHTRTLGSAFSCLLCAFLLWHLLMHSFRPSLDIEQANKDLAHLYCLIA